MKQFSTIRVIVLACMKGGSGRTTVAGHLGVTLERLGEGPVVFFDFDPQESLANWRNRREAAVPAFAIPDSVRAEAVRAKLLALAHAGYRWCVIDTPSAKGQTTAAAIEVADLVVIPVKAGPHDLVAAQTTVEMCHAAGKEFRFLLNEVKTGASASDALLALSSLGRCAPTMVGQRVAYMSSMTDGRTIAEVIPLGKGEEEQIRLAKFVTDYFSETSEPPPKKQARRVPSHRPVPS
jgi:chromosome partitioning protein